MRDQRYHSRPSTFPLSPFVAPTTHLGGTRGPRERQTNERFVHLIYQSHALPRPEKSGVGAIKVWRTKRTIKRQRPEGLSY